MSVVDERPAKATGQETREGKAAARCPQTEPVPKGHVSLHRMNEADKGQVPSQRELTC